MKRLTKPDLDSGEVYASCVGAVTDGAAVARFQAAAQAMLQLAQQYDIRAAANQLHLFQATDWGQDAQVVVGAVTKGELIDLYTDKMSRRNRPARTYYDQLMLLAPLGKCPYCGFGHVATLDHFVSKARYPAFSVLPLNLIPSCSDCNKGKGVGVLDANNHVPHPYYEGPTVEANTWLYASVVQTSPANVTYFTETPNWWPDSLATRVKNHFRDFRLAARFAVEAASEMISLSDYLAQLGSANLIETHLRQVASVERTIRRNSWKAALYEALADSAWYREGGWRSHSPVL
jgi:5-methylcytosine-specific restriction endonuclease McrA